jgi:hypothetical protein
MKRVFEHKKYINSPDAIKVSTLKNKYYGKRCFIIGNGSSLRIDDLERLTSEYTFAVNSIWKIFEKTKWRPSFYCCVDSVGYSRYFSEIMKMDVPFKFSDIRAKRYFADTCVVGEMYFIFHDYPFKIHRYDYEEPQISEECANTINAGYTVTFTAIQLAFYMGFKEIYLLGIDHSYAKQIDSRGKVIVDKSKETYSKIIGDDGLGIQYTDITSAAYISAKTYADDNGIVIKNATRGGLLEIFDRIDINDVIYQ